MVRAKRLVLRSCFVVFCFGLASISHAQGLSAVQLKNINTGTAPSDPQEFVAVSGTIFFSAFTPQHGRELWKSDGTAAGTMLVKDIDDGPNGSSPYSLTEVNGTLFFSACESVEGCELWKSDGTAAGTVLVKAIQPGAGHSSPQTLANCNGVLFFAAFSPSTGMAVWKSDGTLGGTVMVKDVPGTNGASLDSWPYKFFASGGITYFVSHEGSWESVGADLWKTDGTDAGTVLLKADIGPAYIGWYMADVDGTLFFSAVSTTFGTELWKSNGTPGSTVMVKDINPGSGSSGPHYSMVKFAGKLYFTAYTPDTGYELWSSDGTAAGTTTMDVVPGTSSLFPEQLTTAGGRLFFIAKYQNTYELWQSDGSPGGTSPVTNLEDNPNVIAFGQLTGAGNQVFFVFCQAGNAATGCELWTTNSTSLTTTLLVDAAPGPDGSSPGNFKHSGGVLFYSADDGAHGRELWRSDGTVAGTFPIDINLTSASSSPSGFAVANGTAFFRARDVEHGYELWKTDGTPRGTILVKDIAAGPSSSWPDRLTTVGSLVFFVGCDASSGCELWKTDGTSTGTTIVRDIYPGSGGSYPSSLTQVDTGLFFFVGSELWRSDGTSSGTVSVSSLDGYPATIVAVGQTAFVMTQTYSHPQYALNLWTSNGTPEGTTLVAEGVVAEATQWTPLALAQLNGRLVFPGYAPYDWQPRLFVSDGTAEGTGAVGEVLVYPYSELAVLAGHVYFSGCAGEGCELWKSDGTDAGTLLVKDIEPSASSQPLGLQTVNGAVFFTAYRSDIGYELWRSDGTQAGTVFVADINPGPASSYLGPTVAVSGGAVVFGAQDGVGGFELWQTTAAGASLVSDIFPGSSSSYPGGLSTLAGNAVFSADDGSNGNEPWIVGWDSESDGWPDVADNCPAVANAAQSDADGDGIGDACEPLNVAATGPGTGVVVAPIATLPDGTASPVSISFGTVTSGGDTTVTTSTGGPPPPDGFRVGQPPVYYDVSTSAIFTGSVSLCFTWREGEIRNEANARLLHKPSGSSSWVDITTTVDTGANRICGTTTGLSPFVIAEQRIFGFYQPVDDLPTVNRLKAGSAVPVKFSLGGNEGLQIFQVGYPAAVRVTCDASAPLAAVEETVLAGGNSLSYDPATDRYTYVWKTMKEWAGTCRQLQVRLTDGTTKGALFNFIK